MQLFLIKQIINAERQVCAIIISRTQIILITSHTHLHLLTTPNFQHMHIRTYFQSHVPGVCIHKSGKPKINQWLSDPKRSYVFFHFKSQLQKLSEHNQPIYMVHCSLVYRYAIVTARVRILKDSEQEKIWWAFAK